MEIAKYSIDEDLARAAKHSNSFSDYVENSETNNYIDLLNKFKRAVDALIERYKDTATSEQMDLVEYYSNKYSRKLAEAINRNNSIKSSVPSIMIAGAGNFPMRKKEKQNAAREKFWAECGDLFNPTGNYYFNKIQAMLSNKTIYSNDALAIEKLQNKLNDLEESQTKMKALNAYYRKNKTVKGYEGISDENAAKIDAEIQESWYKQPCAPFVLQSNNAEMKRIKSRILEITKLKERAEKPIADKYPKVDGVTVVENAEAMRIQLIFDEKPNEETRTLLKSNGFRWSPSFGAWQRQLTANGIYATKRLLEKLKGEKYEQDCKNS